MIISISSSTLTQTLLLFLAPFLVPRLIRFVTSFFHPNPAAPPGGAHHASPFLASPHVEPEISPQIKLARLCVVTLTISYLLARCLIPTENLFLHLAPSRTIWQTWFPILRTPIELKRSTAGLEQLWSRRKVLNEQDRALLSRLSTFDARELYLSYGSSPLLHCTWCSPTSYFDYLFVLLPTIAIKYLSVATIDSILLMGSQGRRKRWRVYVVGAVLVGFWIEVYLRWSNVGSSTPMVIDSLVHHLIPPLLLIPTLLASYLLPPTPIHPTTTTLLQPHLLNLLHLSQTCLTHLRSIHMTKMALMTHSETREIVDRLWQAQENELRWAQKDKIVKELLKGVRMEREERKCLEMGREDREGMKKLFGIGNREGEGEGKGKGSMMGVGSES
ncbi:BQ2448_2233 [Microbotryum intermedium]|uniref:BQ2448_2233 protein n=1 Tax=Microbotryum intermedium TaxID=269621 RepID=A0A238FB23_9BASI|nr:BQ2448_2233 [Microbotryum intermedium]